MFSWQNPSTRALRLLGAARQAACRATALLRSLAAPVMKADDAHAEYKKQLSWGGSLEKIEFAARPILFCPKIESVGQPILFKYGRSYHGGTARAPLDGSDAA